MELLALILFAVAALGGLVLAVKHFGGAELPMPVSILHGLLAACGLVVLVLLFVQSEAPGYLTYSLLVMVVAALGGFFLFSFHLRGKRAPTPVVAIHGLAAVVGFVLLALAVL